MYKQRLTSPYSDENGKRKTVFNIRNRPGVYMIYKGGRLRYVGYSETDLYKTMYRHFQSWNDRRQIRVTYDPDKVKVRVIYCRDGIQADRLEKALILKHKPIDNPNKYTLFEADKEEKKVLREFIQEPTQPIAQYEGDLPF